MGSSLKTGIAATAVLLEILRRSNVFLLHGAAVKYNGQAVLLVAPSGGGKTTLACLWATVGNGSLMADDRCLLVSKNKQVLCQGILGPVGLFRESEQILSRFGCTLSQRRLPGQKDKLLYDPLKQNWQVEQGPCPIGVVVLLSSQKLPDAKPSQAVAAHVHWPLMQGSAYVGAPEVLHRQFDLISDLIKRVNLLEISSRPKYPDIIGELELAIGAKRAHRRLSLQRPSPPMLRKNAANTATRSLCSLLFTDRPVEKATDWKTVLKLAEYHGLLPLLGHRLSRSGLLTKLPEGLINVVKSEMSAAQAGRLLHLHMISQINRQLAGVNIPWCVMKGPAIAERAYNPPTARPYSDLDIIIPQNAKHIVQKALQPLGFASSAINSSLKHPTNRGEFVLVAHEPSRYVVELHWDYVTGGSLRRYVSCNLASVLERRTTLEIGELKFPVTSIPDQLVGCCIHTAYGHQWSSLRQLLDIILICRLMKNDDLAMAIRISRDWGVLNAVNLSMFRAGRFFDQAPKKFYCSAFPQGVANWVLGLIASVDMTIRPWLAGSCCRRNLTRLMLKLRYV